MTDENLMTEVVHTLAETNFHRKWAELNELAPGLPKHWEDLPPYMQRPVLEDFATWAAPMWPILDRYIERDRLVSMEHADVLRARIEMHIRELKGRGDYTLAAELLQIINAEMEDWA